MAKVTRSKKVSKKTAKHGRKDRLRRRNLSDDDFELPTEVNETASDWRRFAYLIYGTKKIGKTSFCSRIKGTFVLQFDKEQLALRIIEKVVPDWNSFLKWLDSLEKAASKNSFPYPCVVIDGVDEWYRQCLTYTCAKMMIDHPTDAGFGKGWDALKSELRDAVNRLLRLPCGVFFVCHEKRVETERFDGTVEEKIVPGIPNTPDEIVNGKVDGWFHYGYVGRRRVLVVQGDSKVNAGHRIEGHFQTTDGRPVREIDMGKSADEAFTNFIAAFNNEQDYSEVSELKTKGGKTKKKLRRRAS